MKGDLRKLNRFHERIARLRFFDPACGCGNFLIITYRELRRLEIAVLKQMRKLRGRFAETWQTDISLLSLIDVDAFYGIELEEFPVRIAEVALWLTDHQMNMELSTEFGQTYTRLPLKKSAHIVQGNALRMDWEALVPKPAAAEKEATLIVISNRSRPICRVPEIYFGSMPNDGGNLLFADDEKEEFLTAEPDAAKFIKTLLSAHEFINGKKRWCLWLKDASPAEMRRLPEIMKRVESVRIYRSESGRAATRKLADCPALFGEVRQPKSNYVLIPRHSSEKRRYVPMSYFNLDHSVSDSCIAFPDASLYHFGVLTSAMHMARIRHFRVISTRQPLFI